MKNYKCGFVAIVGATNVGKSSLFNVLIDLDLSPAVFKAETTQKSIEGILTTDSFQVIFVDTPGFSQPKNQLHKLMLSSGRSYLKKADVILFLTTPTKIEVEDSILNYIAKLEKPKILAINKIDKHPLDIVKAKQAALLKRYFFTESLLISVKQNQNIKDILKIVSKLLPISAEPLFDKDSVTNASMRQIVSEFVREAVLKSCQHEIPYGVATQVEKYKKTSKLTEILVYIYVNKKSAKAIVIGSEGRMIKKIGTKARLKIEKFINDRVFLQLEVKFLKNWTSDIAKLKSLGF